MQQIADQGGKALAARILSFNEVNLDFYFFNDNVFHLGRPKVMPLFKMLHDDTQGLSVDEAVELITENPVAHRFLTEMANRLFTVCAIFLEYPYVQY